MCAHSTGAPILKPEMWADTQGKGLLLFGVLHVNCYLLAGLKKNMLNGYND